MSNTNNIDTQTIFGRVVNVRNVPSRGVTQKIIEIPEEAHVAATTAVYNRDVFDVAATPAGGGRTPTYGVFRTSEVTADAPTTQSAPKQTDPEPATSTVRHAGLVHSVNPVQWLGIKCTQVDFITWIGADSSQGAADRVRELCGVSTRKQIAGNRVAMQLFLTKVYHPFTRFKSAGTQA